MKKILVVLAAIFIAINVMAEEHLSFKGIPIEGSMTEFCQKLKEKGFTPIKRENNTAFFTGNFTGRQSTIIVIATDNGTNVFSVNVFFDPNKEWNILVDTYDYYKDLYSKKYGEPSFSKESNPALSDSNTDLMYELYDGKVVYGSVWEPKGGDIELSIQKSTRLEGVVVIRYRDSQNVENKIQNDLDDI